MKKENRIFYREIPEQSTEDVTAMLTKYYEDNRHKNIVGGKVCYAPVTFPNRQSEQRSDLTGVAKIEIHEVKRSPGKYRMDVCIVNVVTEDWISVRPAMEKHYGCPRQWFIDSAFIVGDIDHDRNVDWKSVIENKDVIKEDDMTMPLMQYVADTGFIASKYHTYLRGYRCDAEEFIWTKLMKNDDDVIGFRPFFPKNVFEPGKASNRAWGRNAIVKLVAGRYIEPLRKPRKAEIPRFDTMAAGTDVPDEPEDEDDDLEESAAVSSSSDDEVNNNKRGRDKDVDVPVAKRIASPAKPTVDMETDKVNGILLTSPINVS